MFILILKGFDLIKSIKLVSVFNYLFELASYIHKILEKTDSVQWSKKNLLALAADGKLQNLFRTVQSSAGTVVWLSAGIIKFYQSTAQICTIHTSYYIILIDW